jgi:hypothetical protein
MTVAAQNVIAQVVAATGQTVFPFAWRCDDSTRVVVYVNDVLDGGFTVQLNADQIASPGGTITRTAVAGGGEVVTIERTTPQTQATALTTYGPFPASTISSILDYVTMLAQEVMAVAYNKCFRAARSTLAKLSTVEVPPPVLGAYLQWQDAGGGLFKLGNTASSPVSLFIGSNEVTGENVTRTGAGTYQLAHVPTPLARVKVYLNGARLLLGTHYVISVGGLITQQAGFISDVGEVVLADYTW